jgi:hypothetical protein
VSGELFVTATRTAESKLKVVPWRVSSTGSIQRLADGVATPEKVSELDVALQSTSAGGGRLVTIARLSGSTEAIKLMSWNVTSAGVVSRLKDSGTLAGSGRLVRVVLGGHGYITTAATVGLDVKVATWSVAADGMFTRRGEATGPADINSCHSLLGHLDGVVCGTRAADGRIKLAAFTTTATGGVTLRSDSAYQAEEGTLVDLVAADGTSDAAGRRVSTIALCGARCRP